jgi:hypothetical protein
MYCPSCGSEYRPGYTECADCEVPLVEHLPDNVPLRRLVPRFPTIPRPPDNRPLLLKVIPYLTFIVGGEAILGLLMGLCDVGTFEKAGKIISGREFLSQAALPLSAMVVVSFAISFVFWREVLWSRHLLIACLLLLTIGQLWSGDVGTELGLGPFTFDLSIPSGLVVFAFACWYLYAKQSVRAYYHGLKAASGADAVYGPPPNTGPQADA